MEDHPRFSAQASIDGRQHRKLSRINLIAIQNVSNMSFMVLDSAKTLNPVHNLLKSDLVLFYTCSTFVESSLKDLIFEFLTFYLVSIGFLDSIG